MSYNILFEIISKSVIPRDSDRLPNSKIDMQIKSDFIDSLILNDKIFFIVEGPNLVITALYRWFSKKEVELLLQNNIIQFIYSPYFTTYLTQQHLHKISTGTGLCMVSSPDPEFNSIYDATNIVLKEQNSFFGFYRKNISRIVENNSLIISNDDFSRYIYETTKSDVKGKIGELYGFKHIKNPENGKLSEELLNRYLDISHSNCILYLSAKSNCSSILGNENTNILLTHRLQNFSINLDKKIDSFSYLKSFEDLPNFGELLLQGKVTLKETQKMVKNLEIGFIISNQIR
jgi:hypothetical protein